MGGCRSELGMGSNSTVCFRPRGACGWNDRCSAAAPARHAPRVTNALVAGMRLYRGRARPNCKLSHDAVRCLLLMKISGVCLANDCEQRAKNLDVEGFEPIVTVQTCPRPLIFSLREVLALVGDSTRWAQSSVRCSPSLRVFHTLFTDDPTGKKPVHSILPLDHTPLLFKG